MQASAGALYIVATPIGNLADMSFRAIETLKEVDRIYAEDTRNSVHLLAHFDIKNQLFALHDHNEASKINEITLLLAEGKNLALISDAGTPLISDPGYKLVHELSQRGARIVPIPGPSALIAALSVAGIATDKFTFEGFLPAKTQARLNALQENQKQTRTQVYYESSHRIVASIQAMRDVFGAERRVTLARELTKMFEEIFYGALGELVEWLQAAPNHQKGEFVVIVAGYEKAEHEDKLEIALESLIKALAEELPAKQAAKLTARLSGLKKNDVYQQVLDYKKS